MKSKRNKNKTLLKSFTAYCNANPDQRFWQALRNWSGYCAIAGENEKGEVEDTFYRN